MPSIKLPPTVLLYAVVIMLGQACHLIPLSPSTPAMVYKVLLVGEGKRFGLSTSSPYVTVAGEFGDSGTVEIPRGENHIDITVRVPLHTD